MLKSMSFPLTVPNRTSKGGLNFSNLSFTAAYSLKSEKDWPVILLNCEAASLTVFTTMCHKEQQTSDNLTVKVSFQSRKFEFNIFSMVHKNDRNV